MIVIKQIRLFLKKKLSSRKVIIRVILGLILIGIAQFGIFTFMNWEIHPMDVLGGVLNMFILFVLNLSASAILIKKRKITFGIILLTNSVISPKIYAETFNQGIYRHLGKQNEAWEFKLDNEKYLLHRGKIDNYFVLYKETIEYSESKMYNPVISGIYKEVDKGWRFKTDSLELYLIDNELIGLWTESDTIELQKAKTTF